MQTNSSIWCLTEVTAICSNIGGKTGCIKYVKTTWHPLKGFQGHFDYTQFSLYILTLFIYFKIFIYLAVPGLSCSTQDLCCGVQDLLVAVCGI